MAEDRTGAQRSWFARPEPGVVRRALWIAVAWAYVAILAAVVVVTLAVLVALLIALIVYLLDFSTRQFDVGTAWGPARVVAWIVFPLAGIVSIWTAAYGSTQDDSVRRAGVGVLVAAAATVVAWFGSSLALPAVALALGWSLAIPAEHPGRWLARVALVFGLLPLFPVWEAEAIEIVAPVAVLGPAIAGLSVLVGDTAWAWAARLRARGQDEVVRAPSSLDV